MKLNESARYTSKRRGCHKKNYIKNCIGFGYRTWAMVYSFYLSLISISVSQPSKIFTTTAGTTFYERICPSESPTTYSLSLVIKLRDGGENDPALHLRLEASLRPIGESMEQAQKRTRRGLWPIWVKSLVTRWTTLPTKDLKVKRRPGTQRHVPIFTTFLLGL